MIDIIFFACIVTVPVFLCMYIPIIKLKRYRNVKIGMSEAEMLNIMGNGYSKSLLSNNREKYEWRFSLYSTSNYYRVRKVDIYTKNGIVQEVRPYNI